MYSLNSYDRDELIDLIREFKRVLQNEDLLDEDLELSIISALDILGERFEED